MRRFGVPAWAIGNPFAVIAVYAAIVLAAIAAALYVLPIRMMPYVESPLIAAKGLVHMTSPFLAVEPEEEHYYRH